MKEVIEKAVKHPNVAEFLSQANGKLASSEQQLKKGTMVLEFENGYQWMAYANGYLREVSQLEGSMVKVITKPKDGFTYEDMGLDFYTQYAVENFQKKVDSRRKSGKKKLDYLKKNTDKIIMSLISKALNSNDNYDPYDEYYYLDGILNPDYQYLNSTKLYKIISSLETINIYSLNINNIKKITPIIKKLTNNPPTHKIIPLIFNNSKKINL